MKLGIFGQQGSGKTFIGVLLARLIQRQWPGTPIYTNVIGRNGDPYFITLTDLGDFPFQDDDWKDTHLDHQWRSPKILLVDEAMMSVSSRNAGSNVNELWSRAFAFFRKNNVVLTCFMTHRPSMLDNRFREQLDAVVMCRKNPTHFDYMYMDLVTQITLPFTVQRDPSIFKFANYATYQMPLPIEVFKLAENPLFELKKFDKRKVKIGNENA